MVVDLNGDDSREFSMQYSSVVQFLTIIMFSTSSFGRNDHTTVTAPLPVCSAKLSTVGPG